MEKFQYSRTTKTITRIVYCYFLNFFNIIDKKKKQLGEVIDFLKFNYSLIYFFLKKCHPFLVDQNFKLYSTSNFLLKAVG